MPRDRSEPPSTPYPSGSGRQTGPSMDPEESDGVRDALAGPRLRQGRRFVARERRRLVGAGGLEGAPRDGPRSQTEEASAESGWRGGARLCPERARHRRPCSPLSRPCAPTRDELRADGGDGQDFRLNPPCRSPRRSGEGVAPASTPAHPERTVSAPIGFIIGLPAAVSSTSSLLLGPSDPLGHLSARADETGAITSDSGFGIAPIRPSRRAGEEAPQRRRHERIPPLHEDRRGP